MSLVVDACNEREDSPCLLFFCGSFLHKISDKDEPLRVPSPSADITHKLNYGHKSISTLEMIMQIRRSREM